ncbi:helix-turn-helix domain-containing protein [Lactococcus hircilactis]|uniref:Helix-turn-helix domain-containing protein n=1 Tax=Lactococcus hircilactis TaxID=1494462 RepID=A0A7X1ZBT8_9LACT|nr:helix-turn-helix transcriptional regulator [Lactococcus hircilactis]MQW40516.1 helix-turn-helix domain-containing protein [Lactococcus hircilactis]
MAEEITKKLPPKISLKAARVNAGYSAKEVGEIIGKNYQTILKYEQDSSNIPLDLGKQLSKIYEYPFNYIFLGKKIVLKQYKEIS